MVLSIPNWDGRCPCCSNPWNRGFQALDDAICANTNTSTSDPGSKNVKQKSKGLGPLVGGGLSGGHYALMCDECGDSNILPAVQEKDSQKCPPGIDPDDFDHNVDPGEDFYEFATGNWKRKNPIPAEYPSWNVFVMLSDMNQKRLKEMVEGLQSEAGGTEASESGGVEKKVFMPL